MCAQSNFAKSNFAKSKNKLGFSTLDIIFLLLAICISLPATLRTMSYAMTRARTSIQTLREISNAQTLSADFMKCETIESEEFTVVLCTNTADGPLYSWQHVVISERTQ